MARSTPSARTQAPAALALTASASLAQALTQQHPPWEAAPGASQSSRWGTHSVEKYELLRTITVVLVNHGKHAEALYTLYYAFQNAVQ